jgi:hypothetical protein
MIIAHVADIQVKNREKNLYIPYKLNLDEIIAKIKANTEIECSGLLKSKSLIFK